MTILKDHRKRRCVRTNDLVPSSGMTSFDEKIPSLHEGIFGKSTSKKKENVGSPMRGAPQTRQRDYSTKLEIEEFEYGYDGAVSVFRQFIK